ncbi:CaiB/BaiF CoA transferase family protein [Sphingomicrobium aestuariivivum]|uniref:CaiB/BaiF CoA transferase family protein n=1 Tax=Sphingomicrobium aestuariivivum TaxID=1582356 RepID=UPI001FD6A543|nr:CaiB/BaiF CoA-transferase family protein [Sphingomicrobium aestuariivivum]MCJ8190272.1 CoA transferase [Sphingomicrobium aestuariivivum]
MSATPLTGLKVLDLSRVLAGPWCTQLLADLGAEVVKIERPGAGDDTRHWGPPWHEHGDERVAAYFLAANRGKKSVALDFSSPEGAAVVRKMAADADVLVENYKVGGLAKYGLDAASLRAANPKLIYASVTGFGQDGPYAARAGYDYIIQAMGGMMSLTGLPDDMENGGPLRVGVAIADIFTGMYTASAILAALHERETTGKGAHVDMALFDTQLAVLANQASNAMVSGRDPGRQGNSHPNIVPYQPFMASDQPLIIAVGNDGQFARLAKLCGHPEWVEDERFATNAARVANREAIVAKVGAVIADAPAAQWMEKLLEAGIPAGPINSVSQALADPQAQHRGARQQRGEGALGAVPMVGSPIRLDGQRADASLAPPALGEHTSEVLAHYCDANTLGVLKAAGITN